MPQEIVRKHATKAVLLLEMLLCKLWLGEEVMMKRSIKEDFRQSISYLQAIDKIPAKQLCYCEVICHRKIVRKHATKAILLEML
jgi:hypothetical protein